MSKGKTRFTRVGNSAIGIETSPSTSGLGGLGEISVAIRSERRDAVLFWKEPVNRPDGGSEWTAQSDGLTITTVLLPLEHIIKFDVSIKSESPKSINYCMLNFDFLPSNIPQNNAVELDEIYVPHLLPGKDMIIADAVFRSPAIVARCKTTATALIPDLDAIPESRAATWAMNFDRKGIKGVPRLSLGLMKYRPKGHVFFKALKNESINVPREGLSFSGFILFSSDAGENYSRDVLRFLWDCYGVKNYCSISPQVLSIGELAGAALNRLFKRDDLYREFEYQGVKCGGVVTFSATREKPLTPIKASRTRFISSFNGITTHLTLTYFALFGTTYETGESLQRLVHKQGVPFIQQTWFQSWFNAMRTAYGARIMADRWKDERLAVQATRIKNLALSAPDEDGIFSAICFFPENKVWWKRGSLTFMAIEDYHTPDQATTGYFMLRWYKNVEPEPALLEKARGLGRFFIKHQLAEGAVPAWIKGRTHRHSRILLKSASTAGPMMFMALLAALDKDEAVLESAKKMAGFIEEQVLPKHLWYDYETVFSCSRHPQRFMDKRTGIPPQNGMSMLWATEGSRLLFELTGEPRYLELMKKCLDDLLWLQQIWNASVVSINPFGGFGSMNTDAEWNDARQGIIAPVLLDAYRATGDPHYFQRGVAAVRACYITMLHPAMKEVAPGNMVYYRDSDYGSIYENYAHNGFDRVIWGYLEPDWGAGTAVYASAHAMKFYGDLFVDLKRDNAFGINGCNVKKLQREGSRIKLDVEFIPKVTDDPQIVVDGAAPETIIEINGKVTSFNNFSQ